MKEVCHSVILLYGHDIERAVLNIDNIMVIINTSKQTIIDMILMIIVSIINVVIANIID